MFSALPFLLPLAGLVAGILCADRALGSGDFPLWAAGIITLTGVTAGLLLNRMSRNPVRGILLSRFNPIWILTIFFGVGLTGGSLLLTESPYAHPRLDNMVSRLPSDSEMTLRLTGKSTNAYGDRWLCELISLHSSSRKDSLERAESLCPNYQGASFFLNLPVSTLTPGDIISVPAVALGKRYIHPSAITHLGHRASFTLWAASVQKRFCIFIEKSPLNRETSSFLCALLAGERSSLSPSLRQSFSDTGLSHILAVSGMHVGVIVAIAFWIFFPASLAGKWRLRRLLTIGAVWGFVILSGMSPSTLRAAIMTSVAFLAYTLQSRRSPANSLLAAAFLILLVNPSSLFDMGFQFSFLCVGSLIAFAEPLNMVDHRTHPRLYRITQWMLVPLVATICTSALGAYYFGRVPLGFMPLNLLAVPLLPGYVALALLYLLMWSFGTDLSWIRMLLEGSLRWLHEAAEWISGDGATVIHLELTLPYLLLWLLLLLIAAYYLNRRPSRQ